MSIQPLSLFGLNRVQTYLLAADGGQGPGNPHAPSQPPSATCVCRGKSVCVRTCPPEWRELLSVLLKAGTARAVCVPPSPPPPPSLTHTRTPATPTCLPRPTAPRGRLKRGLPGLLGPLHPAAVEPLRPLRCGEPSSPCRSGSRRQAARWHWGLGGGGASRRRSAHGVRSRRGGGCAPRCRIARGGRSMRSAPRRPLLHSHT
jgi:hypothetical protein